MGAILEQAIKILEMFCNKAIWGLSVALGVFLSAIGYPKEVLVFILTLIVVDLFTKQYSIVVINYKVFSLSTYKKAWVERKLTSRQLKNGLSIKIMLYFPILYVANKTTSLKEIIGGAVISSVLYSLLMLIETTSIIENFIDCGHTELLPFLKFIKKKEQEITDSQEEN